MRTARRPSRLVPASLALALLAALSPGSAQTGVPAQDCDRLAQPPRADMAGSPALVDGVAPGRIDIPRARAACAEAMARFPGEPRFAAFAARLEAELGAHAEAARLYRRAADQGHAGAQYELGWLYVEALGVGRDDAEAARLFRRAAEQGHALAQTNLGAMHEEGVGVERDRAEAIRWFRLAAAQGNGPARGALLRLGVE